MDSENINKNNFDKGVEFKTITENLMGHRLNYRSEVKIFFLWLPVPKSACRLKTSSFHHFLWTGPREKKSPNGLIESWLFVSFVSRQKKRTQMEYNNFQNKKISFNTWKTQ